MQNSLVTKEWIEKANSDLDFAKASFSEFDQFYVQMCILCHDAVEKYLKGYMVSQKKKPKRIHDLVALVKECFKFDEEFKDYEDDCRILNPYYIPLKYPSHYPICTKRQAEQAIEVATRIEDFIKKKIR